MPVLSDKQFKVIIDLLKILDNIFDDALNSEGISYVKKGQYKLGKKALKKLFKQLEVNK